MDRDTIKSLLYQISQGSPPGPMHIDKFDVGTNEYIAFFEKNVLDGLIFQGYSTCRVYDGPYGSGKSHILNMLQGLAIRKRMIFSKKDISGFDNANFQDWHYVVRSILEELSFYDGDRMIKGLPAILKAISENINNNISLENLSHRGLANAINQYLHLLEFEQLKDNKLSNFILGNKVTAREMREAHIRGVKNPLNKRNAEYFLNTALNMLYNLGYPVMLLFDENEQHFVNPRSLKNKVAANIIRRIVDNCSNGSIKGTVIVFTVVRGFIENIAQAYQAVGERLMPPSLDNFTWRWPVLKIEDVSTISDGVDFLNQCISKYLNIAEKAGVDRNIISNELRTAGERIIAGNPGISYRRELSRLFANIVYNLI